VRGHCRIFMSTCYHTKWYWMLFYKTSYNKHHTKGKGWTWYKFLS